jgi:hypothetical protein
MRWRTAAVAGALMCCMAPASASAAEVSGIGTYARPDGNTLGHWDLRYSPTAGAAEAAFDYGDASTLPVVGDWDDDGKADIGTMTAGDRVNALFRLRTATGTLEFRFGSGLIGVAGDFNGDGRTDIGTYTPPTALNAAGRWQLRYTLTAGPADLTFDFGSDPTGLPVTGDWNGDGTTEVGLYIPGTENSSGRWQLRSSSAGLDFNFGEDAPYPVTGDWNGDGATDIGVYTPPSRLAREGRWMLRSSTSEGRADLDFRFGEGNYPVAGDWNGIPPVVVPQPTATPTPDPAAAPIPTATPGPGPVTRPAPLPINARLTYFWTARGSRLTIGRLTARELPSGSTVTISCSGKRCPFKRKTVKPKGTARNLLTSLGKQKVFRAGQTVDIRIAAPGHHSKVLRFKLARGEVPVGRAYCVRAGEKTLRARC